MPKLKLEIDTLQVESFEPKAIPGERGTVRGQLTAYYELCHEGDTWQNSCTCEPTCNARTCYNCGTGTGTGTGATSNPALCQLQSIPLTNCSICEP